MQPHVGLQTIGELDIVLAVQTVLQRIGDLGGKGGILRGTVGRIGLDMRRSGAISMQGAATPKANVVSGVGKVVEIGFQAPVPDSGQVA